MQEITTVAVAPVVAKQKNDNDAVWYQYNQPAYLRRATSVRLSSPSQFLLLSGAMSKRSFTRYYEVAVENEVQPEVEVPARRVGGKGKLHRRERRELRELAEVLA